MLLITELNESVTASLQEAEDGKKKDLYIEGIFLQGNLVNGNGRKYPTEVLATEVNRYVETHVMKNRAYGELGHPAGPTINPDRISHRIVELKQDGDNWIGKAKIASRGMGEIVRGIIEDGGQLAVSSRGMGTIKEVDGIDVVQEDFMLATAADIVIDPSAPDAFVNGILEGKEWVMESGVLVERVRKKWDKAARSVSRKTEDAILEDWQNFLNRIQKS